jgi:hypothetical protein
MGALHEMDRCRTFIFGIGIARDGTGVVETALSAAEFPGRQLEKR